MLSIWLGGMSGITPGLMVQGFPGLAQAAQLLLNLAHDGLDLRLRHLVVVLLVGEMLCQHLFNQKTHLARVKAVTLLGFQAVRVLGRSVEVHLNY